MTKRAQGSEEPTKQPRTSGRYRKVEVRTWGDEKFRRLTPIPPCGQGLWLFLITSPHTGPIPGLFRAGRAAMAEELGWELEDFQEAFQEAFREGMVEADFKARVVWVPNAIRHNKPESPNVVRSWAAEFDLIPECPLKWKALEALKASIHAIGEAYAKAFDETFRKPSGKPLPKTSPNQEQEQEQEQDKPSSLRSEGGAAEPPPSPPPPKAERKKRKPRETLTFTAYVALCKASDTKPVPDGHFIRDWCDGAGIGLEMQQVAWAVFRERYLKDEKYKGKQYKDWAGHFANAVQGNWLKLWYVGDDGKPAWTTVGLTHKAALDAQIATKEAVHGHA